MWPTRTWVTGSEESAETHLRGDVEGQSLWSGHLNGCALCATGWLLRLARLQTRKPVLLGACIKLHQTALSAHFQLTFRGIALSALILSSCYCLGSAYYSHLILNALCATALLLWLCSPGYWQACPAWCLYQTAPNSTFSSHSEWQFRQQ